MGYNLVVKPQLLSLGKLRAWAAGLLLIHGCGSSHVPPAPPGESSAEAVERMATGYEQEWPEVPQMRADELPARQWSASDGPLLVDCRSVKERAVSILPGSVALADWESARQVDPERPLLLYCTIGYRSTRAAAGLRKRGIDARNLHGGVLAWAHAGGNFVDPEGRATRRVHVYGRPWDLLPSGYTSEHGDPR